MALFGHIAPSLITVIIIWIHVLRISKPKIFPPRKLIIYVSIALGNYLPSFSGEERSTCTNNKSANGDYL